MNHFCFTLCIFYFSFGLRSIVYVAASGNECKIVQQKRPPSCCKYIYKKNNAVDYEKKMKTCSEKYSNNLKKPPSESAVMTYQECFFECYLNASNLLNSNFKPSFEKMQKLNKPGPRWRAINEAAVKKCFQKSIADGKKSLKCKSGSFQLIRCVQREAFLHCPKESWVKSNECKKYKSLVERCPNLFPEIE